MRLPVGLLCPGVQQLHTLPPRRIFCPGRVKATSRLRCAWRRPGHERVKRGASGDQPPPSGTVEDMSTGWKSCSVTQHYSVGQTRWRQHRPGPRAVLGNGPTRTAPRRAANTTRRSAADEGRFGLGKARRSRQITSGPSAGAPAQPASAPERSGRKATTAPTGRPTVAEGDLSSMWNGLGGRLPRLEGGFAVA